MEIKIDKKQIGFEISSKDLDIIDKASLREGRSRSNFIIFHILNYARGVASQDARTCNN